MTFNRLFALFFFFIFSLSIFAQFKISQNNSGFDKLNDPLFLGITSTRSIKNLNDDWKCFFPDSPENFSKVSFPLSFTSQQLIVFEKEFNLSPDEFLKNFVQLQFLGINYSAEIFVNNSAVYKHAGGEIPFTIDLPQNILNFDTPNVIRIIIQYSIDSQNTIPLLQRFLFPKNYGGILRDVYLSFRPKAGINKVVHSIAEDIKPYEGRINFEFSLTDINKSIADSLIDNFDGRFKLEAQLQSTLDTAKLFFDIWNVNPSENSTSDKSFYVRLKNLVKWDTQKPNSYLLTLKLTNGDRIVIDEYKEIITTIDFVKREKNLFLNDHEIDLEGTTYLRSFGSNYNYSLIENDINTIKEAGFNTVRFSKAFPHPYALYLCNKLGLLALVEIPLNSVPERFVNNENFSQRSLSFLSRAINFYSNYQNVIAYGIGGSYLSNSESHFKFISEMSSHIKKLAHNRLSYASFIGFPTLPNVNLDLFGIETYSNNVADITNSLENIRQSDSLIYFISEATYPTYKGTTNGYLNNYSFEGQAKFFDDIISLVRESNLKGFTFNSIFDYEGDYTSLYSGYNKDNNYLIGILPSDGNKSRISYNVIKSRLVSGAKVSVPIGNDEEDAPLFFIITALIISVIIALLINSKRKFREDTTRALLRPYNFYADIRDQRILTGFHSNILMFLLAGSNALLATILLYFFKNSFLVEKILLAFGDDSLISFFGSLASDPQAAFIYLYIATIIIFIFMSIIVQLSSFFVKTKVHYTNVYSVAIWAFLPLALLLPIEAILYKLLLANTYNYIIIIVLFFFLIWNIQRVIKGIYVIFDIRPFVVYSSVFVVILILSAGVGLYFQMTVSVFDYLSLAVKQFLLL